MSYVWWKGARLGLLIGLGLGLGSQVGCRRHESLSEPASREQLPTAIDEKALSRTDILLQLARIPHAEVTTRLGPHRLESHTRWTITPLGPPRPEGSPPDVTPGFRDGNPARPFEGAAAFENAAATLDETRFIEVDAGGRLQLSTQNDHGYGVEAVAAQDALYLRMRHAPYIRHRPEGDELERLRALAYEPGTAILEAVAPFVYLSTPSETTRLGRPAWQVSLSRQQPSSKPEVPANLGLGKTWRGTVEVEALDGYAVVDRQRGTLLELKLQVRFTTPRGKAPPGTAPAEAERVQVAAQHEFAAVALGKDVVNIQLPAEWSEPPARSRPTLDKQELLNGLVPARP